MPTYYLLFALQCLFPIFDATNEYLGISIVDTDAVPREFTVTATSSDGKSAKTGRVTLNADRQRAFLLQEVVGAGAPTSGWIRIDSDANGCAHYLASGNDQVLLNGIGCIGRHAALGPAHFDQHRVHGTGAYRHANLDRQCRGQLPQMSRRS